jgi:TonB family protein
MTAATSLALEKAPRRAFPRLPVKVPLDVIALRSGVPQSLPGRCVDMSEGGLGAMVAGELSVGQAVAVELRLPHVGLPVRAKAVVRYHGGMRCGFEFVGLPTDQREMIRYWAFRLSTEPPQSKRARTEPQPARQPEGQISASHEVSKIRIQRPGIRLLLAALVVFLGLAGVALWQWQHSWSELESGAANRGPLRVSPGVMATRILSKAEPVYPDEARRAGIQGMAVLDVIIAADGTVRKIQPLSGDALLVNSATDAVRQWKFEPYRSGSRPAEVETTIAVEFRLN